MKTLNQKRTRKIMLMAMGLLALIATICISTDVVKGAGATVAMAVVVGGVTMEGKEEALYNALKESIQSEVSKFDKGYIDEATMTKNINAALAKFAPNIKDDEEFKKMAKKLEDAITTLQEHGLALKAAKEIGGGQIPKSIADQIKAHKEANKDKWEAMKKSGAPSFEIELKVAGTMLESTNVGTGTLWPAVGAEPGVVDLARQVPDMLQYMNYSKSTLRVIYWVEKTNPDGNAGWTAEGGVKPLIDFEYKTVTSTIKKVTDKIKVSTEMLDDVDSIAADIKNELKYKVDIAVNTAIISGDGLNDSIEGIAHWASLYVLTTITTTTPNDYDAILAVATQIRNLFHMPTHAFINPIDGANMELRKDTTGGYVIPPFSTADGKKISGLKVVETPSIPQGYILVGDMMKAKVREKGDFVVTVGWVSDDFEKNLVTMLGERRLHLFIADNDSSAFVYDTFANVKTAMTLL